MDLDIGKKLKFIREDRGWTQANLSKRSGVSQTIIALLESGKRKFTQKTLEKILKALSVDYGTFFVGDMDHIDVPNSQAQGIPIISWNKIESYMGTDMHSRRKAKKPESVIPHKKVGSKSYALLIKDDSMEPRFMPGDIIIVDPDLNVKKGDFCVVKINNEIGFKIVKRRNKETRLTTLNDRYPEVIVNKKSRVDFLVLGKIVDMIPKLS